MQVFMLTFIKEGFIVFMQITPTCIYPSGKCRR